MGFQYNQTAEQGNFSAVITGIKGDAVISGLSVGESSPAAMSVLVAAGNCTVAGIVFEEGSGQNVSVTAADAVNPRKDIITYDPTTTNPICTAGTPAAIPVPPDIPSGDILLAIVYVEANAATIVNADIEDGRVFVDNGLPIRSVSASDTALDADTVITVNATGGARTITLPTAVGVQGKIYVIKKTDSSSNTVTVDGDGAETIDGETTFSLKKQWVSVMIQSDGANWVRLDVTKQNKELSDATVILDEFTNTSNITDFDDTTSASGLGDFAGNSVTYDFGENVYMVGVRYKVAYNTQDTLNHFTVMSSLDNVTYVACVDATASSPGGGSHDSVNHILRRSRYVRVRVKDNQDSGNVTWTVYDVQVGVMGI